MKKINLGSGRFPFEGWDNLDLVVHPGVIRHDLRTPLPYPTNSVDYAFSEHFIEHLSREDGVRLLKEVYRVLKPKGVFRIVTPDLYHLCLKYMQNDHTGIPGCWEPATPCQMVNEGMRSWGHQFLYDTEEMELILKEAGFVHIVKEGYRVSKHPELQNLELRPYNSEIIMEVTK